MPRFFLSASNIADGIVTICGDDALHISRSLRMRRGEEITVCDMQKIEYRCVLEDFTADTVTARILASKPSDTEPPCPIRLYQALPKSDKLDVIIQKAVESGASAIIPFESERCVVRADDPSRESKKLERRRRIALEAAKQCGRGVVPEVSLPMSFSQMLKEASGCELKLFFYEGDGTVSLRGLLEGIDGQPESIAIIVGAEGGFSLREVETAREASFALCGLGQRILRCETASGFALACLAYRFELN
ncbi:MAG: 16S rRNA (uracil(1498)-N(3))-methyltransferase [Clostridia bacterium]|nr:16S rRNA (uracil(1498)-N(3))-methyltransferase [Clostridia bacterium]